ncbi:hypothetical protein CANCADRAFT_16549, partial [Tortispora caseinolytica NRRL Y-17796]
NHLIITACHTIWKGGSSLGEDESEWDLEVYQTGQHKTFIEHIQKGLQLLSSDPNSILIFTGGQTHANLGARSEAGSYFDLASQAFVNSTNLLQRITTEEYALDSFDNLLYSIARFKEFTGNYPQKITVISFEFKRNRFINLHRKAIRFPMSSFGFIGIDPEGLESNIGESEISYSVRPFESDMYACRDPILVQKKMQRNPFHRTPPYYLTCPELLDIL